MLSSRAAVSPTSSARSQFAVEAGEVIVIASGEPHIVSSSPGLRAPPAAGTAAAAAAAGHLPCMVTHGTEGPAVRLICGFLACDARPFNPLLENLPAVLKAGVPGARNPSWLALFARQVMNEAADRRTGSEGVIARLSELMFIEVVRQYLEQIPEGQTGWLAGLHDRSVGNALSLMHGAPDFDWTVEELARQSGVSRAVLAERFARLVGCPPILYLSKWRMQLAWRRLRSSPVEPCDHCRRERLPVGGRFQPRFQAHGWFAALCLSRSAGSRTFLFKH